MARRPKSTIPQYKRRRKRSLPGRILGGIVKLVVAFFPSFGSMQFSVDGGFTGSLPWGYTLISLAWVVGLTAATLIIFSWKTRSPGVKRLEHHLPGPAAQEVEA